MNLLTLLSATAMVAGPYIGGIGWDDPHGLMCAPLHHDFDHSWSRRRFRPVNPTSRESVRRLRRMKQLRNRNAARHP